MDEHKMTADEFFKREERREKSKKRIKLMLIPLYYIIYIPLFILCYRTGEVVFEVWAFMVFFMFAPCLYYLSMFKPDLMFEIRYIFDPCIKDPEPSDWYYFSCEIGAYVILAAGPILAGFAFVSTLLN